MQSVKIKIERSDKMAEKKPVCIIDGKPIMSLTRYARDHHLGHQTLHRFVIEQNHIATTLDEIKQYIYQQNSKSHKAKLTNIKLNGHTYKDLNDLANHIGLNHASTYERYRQFLDGNIPEEKVDQPKKTRHLVINGRYYKDLRDVAKRNHLPLNTVRYRYYRYRIGRMPLENIIMPLKYNNVAKSIDILSMHFETQRKACEYFDRNINDYVLKYGRDTAKWPKEILDDLEKQSKHPYQYKHIIAKRKIAGKTGRAYPVNLCGRHFESVTEAAKYCNISLTGMLRRISKYGFNDPRVLEVNHNFVVDGQKVQSYAKLAAKLHTTPKTLHKYTAKYGYTAKSKDIIKFAKENRLKAVSNKIGKSITINGKYYQNMSVLARAIGISRQGLALRFKNYEQGKITKEELIEPIGSYKGLNKNGRIIKSGRSKHAGTGRPGIAITLLGKTFSSITQADIYYSNLNIRHYVRKYGKDDTNWPKKAIEKMKEQQEIIEYSKKLFGKDEDQWN